MTFLLRTPTSPKSVPRGRALEEWRRQARLVRRLWETYVAVGGDDDRAVAFSAYMAALDGEEAAANNLAGFSLAKVA